MEDIVDRRRLQKQQRFQQPQLNAKQKQRQVNNLNAIAAITIIITTTIITIIINISIDDTATSRGLLKVVQSRAMMIGLMKCLNLTLQIFLTKVII